MTEDEWLACTDPEPMLALLLGNASDRKLRLFDCACCRRIWHRLTDPRSRRAVELAEQIADGECVPSEELAVAVRDAGEVLLELGTQTTDLPLAPFDAALHVLDLEPSFWAGLAAKRAADAAGGQECSSRMMAQREERRSQAVLVRCIFGDPFHPVTTAPAWLAWNASAVVKMAQRIYKEQAFDRLPILSDALEEAGCTDAAILAHCRQRGEHVRGCWPVDLLLGKK